MRKHIALFFGILLMIMGGCTGQSEQKGTAATINIGGSSTVFKEIIEPALPAFKKKSNISVNAQIQGTGRGFLDFVGGKIDVLLASEPLEDVVASGKELGLAQGDVDVSKFKQVSLFDSQVAVIVNGSNEVRALSKEQLLKLFRGDVNNWTEIGWKDLPIMVVLPSEGRATRQIFKSQIMRDEEFTARAFQAPSTAKVVDIVRANGSAIGFTSTEFVSGGKIRKVQTDRISRPLMIVIRSDASPGAISFAEFMKRDGVRMWEQEQIRRNFDLYFTD